MIEKTVINGRPATAAYLDSDLVPVSPDQATLVKVIFDDGDSMFLVPDSKPKQE